MKLKAVFFDIDGTLLNTHEYIYQSFEFALAKHHKPILRKELQKIMGKPLDECYRILTKMQKIDELSASHRQFQHKNPHLVIPFPNTISTLEKLKEKGLLIAAISTRARDTVDQTLEETQIMHYINYILGFDDVIEPKPSPEGIQKALTYFGLKPQDAIMVGDSPVDVLAGKNAKTQTVGVTYGFHGEKIAEAKPDYVVDDIKEILTILRNQ